MKGKGTTMEPIFDVRGETVGWLNRGKVYSTAGRPRALIRSGAVFSFATVHLGWFGDGFFRDRDGAAVAWIRPDRPSALWST